MSAMTTSMDTFVVGIQELSLARDLDTVMKIVRHVAREITGADGATFILKENDKCFYADENAIGPLWKGGRFPLDSCISGWAMKNRKAAVIEDIYIDERIPIDLYKPTFVKSLAMVPIRTIDPIGAIGNYWAKQHAPTAQEVTILQSLADFTAIAMENIKVHHELEQRVKDRTLQLLEANKELETFSYAVSHDLRAPLRTIGMYMDILTRDCEPKFDNDNRKVVKKINGKIEEMHHLVENLLSFFSMSNKPVQKSLVNMKAMVSEICQTLKEAEPGRTINYLILDLPDAPADTDLIHQVWFNLISNAFKFTRQKSSAVIEIGYETTGKEIVYSVRDNGAGFNMDCYDKLFGVFNRLHGQKEYDGNGVGLAIVQRIVERHGGRVWAEGKENEGAKFFFSLSIN